MCGIAGTFGVSDPSVPSQLIHVIEHRGPDQNAQFFKSGMYTAAACRLSIVGVNSGGQPLVNESKKICVSMNGEIYNHVTLRRLLQNKGHRFSTNCDTEVLVHGYEEFGIDFIFRLEGMFAIALFDTDIETLYLIRDPLGIKPLYYLRNNLLVAYSSEIKSFFHSRLSKGEIDEDYLFFRFIFGFGQIDKTLFTDIQPVIPGSYLLFSKGQMHSYKYKSLTKQIATEHDTEEYSTIIVSQLVEESVTEQIPAEVPWGVFLSGGIDSSILACLANNLSGSTPNLFTLSDESETNDLMQARLVASFLETELVELRIQTSDILDMFSSYILAIEEFEPYSIFWYALAKEARRYIKVAFCGQGADELFGGYPAYHDTSLLTRTFSKRFEAIKSKGSAEVRGLVSAYISRLLSDHGREFLYDFFMNDQLVSYQLGPVDKCTMAWGLEARVPYLSKKLVSHIRSLPSSILFKGPLEKMILRNAFASLHLPNISRKKQFSGINTLPNYKLAVTRLAEELIDEKAWEAHTYSSFFKDKVEMLGFDTLIYILRECNGIIPSHFDLKDMY